MGKTEEERYSFKISKVTEMMAEYAEYTRREMDICPNCGTVLGFKDEKWTKAEGEWAIKGYWEQLPLWSQSELDQI